jgi:hypothetical protein
VSCNTLLDQPSPVRTPKVIAFRLSVNEARSRRIHFVEIQFTGKPLTKPEAAMGMVSSHDR